MYTQKRSRVILFGVILTFTIPLILAGLLFWYGAPLNGKTTNFGELIQPTVPIIELEPTDANNQPRAKKELLGKWVLLTVIPSVCDKRCETSLYSIRQICKATGKEQTRLRQVVLTFKGQKTDAHLEALLQNQYAKTAHWVTDVAKFQPLIDDATPQTLDTQQGAIYFIDPMGNIMMHYTPDANPTGIFKDLSKLLRVSQIG